MKQLLESAVSPPLSISSTADWELARRAPPALLRPFVVGDYHGYRETMSAPCQRPEYPATIVPLIFNFGSRYEIATRASATALGSFSAGLTRFTVGTRSDGRAQCLQVNVTPLFARRLFGMPMSEIAGLAVDLAELLGQDVRTLEQQLTEANDWSRRFALIDAFLLSRIANTTVGDARMELAWWQLEQSGGNLFLGSLAHGLDLTPKGLIALFREHTGLTPKLSCRIIRFEGALRGLRLDRTRNFADLAADCGYADQAHFNRDFAEFTGTTPGAFTDKGV